jgi:hypothetical protein
MLSSGFLIADCRLPVGLDFRFAIEGDCGMRRGVSLVFWLRLSFVGLGLGRRGGGRSGPGGRVGRG